MPDEDKCQGCQSKDSCKEIYKQIGSSSEPSVTVRVLIAFLLPIAVFIIALAISEKILASKLNSQAAVTAISVITAVFITGLVVFIVRALVKKRVNL